MTIVEGLYKPTSRVYRRNTDVEKAREKMDKLEAWLKQKRIELENSTEPCTVCGKTAKYTRDGGWMQGAHYVYTCDDGHESAYSGNQGKTLKS